MKFIYLFLIICVKLLNAFNINSNFKLSRTTDCSINPYDLHRNNIVKYLKTNKYQGKLCKWKFNNNWENYNKSSNIVNTNYKYIYIYENNTILRKTYFNNTSVLKEYNNSNIYLLSSDKIHLCVDNFIKKFREKNYIFNINIYHPYHNDCRINITIVYDYLTTSLIEILFNREELSNLSYYWSNNTLLENIYEEKYINKFLFGYNKLYNIPLIISNKNKNYINKYPYMYELNYNKNNMLFKLPDNIFLNIPLFIINNNTKLIILWKFKNELKSNILDINYFKNGSLNNLNVFSYI